MHVTSEPDFDDYVKDNFIVKEDEDEEYRGDDSNDDLNEEDVAYWSDDDLSEEEKRSVSDEYFDHHLFDDLKEVNIPSLPEFTDQVTKSEVKSPPEYIHPSNLKSPPENTENKNDGNETDGIFDDEGTAKDKADKSPPTFSPVEKSDCSTGICFGPNCVERCFIDNIYCTDEDKRCDHEWSYVDIKLGDYIAFPSSFFHRGYFEKESTKTVVTAQLFASSNGSSSNQPVQYLSSTNTMNYTVIGELAYDFSSLSKDVFEDWESSYPIAKFPPCKYFGGQRINQESNR
jgi:hypothetical protein